ncbi:MAG TPA: hypothetical protein VHS76_03155 [Steroidobacteraceae bacterium]|jgi:hypothetical protein|nr:hypothetical protein [Steroidobacteraceae bacterium]
MAPICALAAVAGAPAHPQEPVAKGSSAAQSAPASVSAAAPVDRKKALQFGFRPGVVKGIAVFCKEEPISGTRFTNKRCVRENEFSAYLARLEIARDEAMKSGCIDANTCGRAESMANRPRMGMGSSR